MSSFMSQLTTTVSSWSASGGISGILSGIWYSILYGIAAGLCWIIGIVNQFFSVMSGMTKVHYEGKSDTLMNVFFGNTAVENVYWAMALIGILLCFVFAIIAAAKKATDSNDKIKQSLGDIITGLVKGIIIIISLTFVISITLNLSDKLLTQINYAFNNADTLGKEDTIEYTDDQFAAMARVLDTIGNYSLNPSYNSRYNLNSCYNEIRADLQYLVQQGVFDFYYDDSSGATWQSALQKIVNAADLNEMSFDVYDTAASDAILACMKQLQTNSSFAPLQRYTREYSSYNSSIPLDRMIFLMSTLRAAKNPIYNQNAAMDDPLRGAYYSGDKSIYSYSDVSQDFDMSSIQFILLFMVAFKLLWDLVVIILDCIARIFNMIFLYLVAPPFIGVMPLDDGAKFKQWTTAFIVQCFGVFGTVISMRVLLLFIPIIANSDLVLFDNDILNLLGKLALILGGMSTAKRASSVLTGILADNAGYQAINATSNADKVRQKMDYWRDKALGAVGGKLFGGGDGKSKGPAQKEGDQGGKGDGLPMGFGFFGHKGAKDGGAAKTLFGGGSGGGGDTSSSDTTESDAPNDPAKSTLGNDAPKDNKFENLFGPGGASLKKSDKTIPTKLFDANGKRIPIPKATTGTTPPKATTGTGTATTTSESGTQTGSGAAGFNNLTAEHINELEINKPIPPKSDIHGSKDK